MSTVYVKPRPGGRVRMPDRQYRVMSNEGDWVPRIDFYERLIIGGDLIVSDPPTGTTIKPPGPPSGGSSI